MLTPPRTAPCGAGTRTWDLPAVVRTVWTNTLLFVKLQLWKWCERSNTRGGLICVKVSSCFLVAAFVLFFFLPPRLEFRLYDSYKCKTTPFSAAHHLYCFRMHKMEEGHMPRNWDGKSKNSSINIFPFINACAKTGCSLDWTMHSDSPSIEATLPIAHTPAGHLY